MGMKKLDAAAQYAFEIGQKYHHLGGEYYRAKVVLPAINRHNLTQFDR
jgi:hypothetical protein